jgi:anti-sigma regulatory factor (Ser/Thr protein kinase)
VSQRRTFPSRPASVRAARHYALDVIGDAPHAIIEAVSIAVSELATNCVLHARTEFTIEVERSADRVRVEVSDLGRGVPTVGSPDSSAASGRGLLLVSELSDEWGVQAVTNGPGKRVWFEIRLQPQRSSADVDS